MKVVKIIVLVVLVLIAIPLVMALFIPKEYETVREIIINKPSQEVFDYVKFLKNQENYHYFVRMDPSAEMKYTGTDGEVGAVYTWDDKKSNAGEQEIKNMSDGRSIETELRFIRPFEGIAYTTLLTETVSPAQTKVTWIMKGSNKYPMNFMNLFVNKTLGEPLTVSLSNLKSILEK